MLRIRPLWILWIALIALAAVPVPQEEDASQVEAIIVTIEGTIDSTTVALMRDALRSAERDGLKAIILEVDSGGGVIRDMQTIQSMLDGIIESEDTIPTVAFVRREAFSAAAYLALVCDELWMAPGSTIGAITPVIGSPQGIQEIENDDARRKIYSAMKTSVRSLVERRSGDKLSERALRVVEGMVDPSVALFDVTYTGEDGFQVRKTMTLDELRILERTANDITATAYDRPVVLDANEALELGVSRGGASSVESLIRDRFSLSMDQVERFEETGLHRAGAWLEALQPFLFVVGFLLLLIELKAPGVAIPGVLGAIMIGLAFFGGYLMGVTNWVEILLLVVGLGLLAFELFLFPGLLIPGVLGFLAVASSLVLSQQSFVWPTTPNEEAILLDGFVRVTWLIIVLIVTSFLMWRFLPKIPILSRVLQAPPEGDDPTGASTQLGRDDHAARLAALVGRTAAATTDLRPAGIVELDGERLDVVAEDGWVEKGTEVVIREIQGNRILVATRREGES